MRTNFTQCQITWDNVWKDNSTIRDLYGWNGSVQHIPKNSSSQISTWGCKQLCGTGIDWYTWDQASSTITTWVLPIIGVIAQAPFVSNAFWDTVFTLARWTGSPMASLAYVLWNIRVSGKAALMVDMATPYEQRVDKPNTDFGSIRDSFYILLTMNQYNMNQKIRTKREAEGLLRIALFSKDLRLLKSKRTSNERGDAPNSLFWNDSPSPARTGSADFPHRILDEQCEAVGHLNTIRQKLALEFRRHRRRGVVPVFLSTLWFLFSMGISIQDSFGDLGGNATAHDLALGYLLGWLPILILSSIVDRNPVSADDVQEKLNKLIGRVRESLENPLIRDEYINNIQDPIQRQRMRQWVMRISKACPDMQKSFFEGFAGQGRVQWHYGVAHPILTDIEKAYIRGEGRDWLSNEIEARNDLVLGTVEEGLDWFDHREFAQVAWAVVIVVGVVAGAWIISYMTPTVGLGCRSGGYTIFVGVSALLLTAEMAIWWILDAEKRRLKKQWAKIKRFRSRLPSLPGTDRSQQIDEHSDTDRVQTDDTTRESTTSLRSQEELADDHHRIQHRFTCWLFRPLEFANMMCLLWLCIAQTFGADETCECLTSTWAPGGGYMDFTQWNTANSIYVDRWWLAGTILSSSVIGLSMLYLVMEWCVQSHLSTADMKAAADGLQNTRRFRRIVYGVLGKPISLLGFNSLVWHANIHCQKRDHAHCVARDSSRLGGTQPPLVIEPYKSVHPATAPSDDGEHSRTSHESLLRSFQRAMHHKRSGSDSSVATQPGASSDEHEALEEDVADGGSILLSPYWRKARTRRSTDASHREDDIELGSRPPSPLHTV